MKKAASPIGVIDSGVGGLSVLKHIRAQAPGEDLVYIADSAHAPYGEKSPDYVIERLDKISRWLVEQQVKALVLACNTATALAVETLRSRFSMPVIGMEPALKPAANMTNTDVIGVLATEGTFNSARYARLHDRFGHSVKTIPRICHQWVRQVESGDLDSVMAERLVASELQPLLDSEVDVLVLGCTHFPFLLHLIEKVAGPGVRILDPAPAVARRLLQQLENHELNQAMPRKGSVRIYSTSDQVETSQQLRKLSANQCAVNFIDI